MIIPSQAVKIVVATKPVDFRKGHDGLAAMVQNELGLDPHSGIIVVFRAKRGDRIKVLLWDPEHQDSIDAAAFIWSNAPEILSAHDKGVLIRSKSGFYLAIPTAAAGKGRGGARLTPGEWERRRRIKLRFIYRRNGPSLLVAEKARINTRGVAVASRSKTRRGQVSAPIFLLVPQVKLRKRLDLARDAERVAGMVPGLIVSNWVER